jgi:hypothetical protein
MLQYAARFHPRSPPWTDAAPVRDELFGAECLEQHAQSLAGAQAVTNKPHVLLVLYTRLNDNAAALLAAYRASAVELVSGRSVEPAVEWLLDATITSSKNRSARFTTTIWTRIAANRCRMPDPCVLRVANPAAKRKWAGPWLAPYGTGTASELGRRGRSEDADLALRPRALIISFSLVSRQGKSSGLSSRRDLLQETVLFSAV